MIDLKQVEKEEKLTKSSVVSLLSKVQDLSTSAVTDLEEIALRGAKSC